VPDAGTICVLLGLSVVTVLVVTFIGAVFLRAAVAIYNLLAGGATSASGVPEPRFLKAMGITLNTTLVNAGMGLLIGLAIGAGTIDARAGGNERASIAAFLGFLICVVVMAGTLMVMLPTNLGKALFVTLCYMGIVALFVAVVGVLAFVVVGVALR
jgi:hypothetical protein